MPTPIEGTYPTYFSKYIATVPEIEIIAAFEAQQKLIDGYFYSIPENKYGFAYAAGKWTLKEVLQHLIDTERIMAYRALCIARKEKQNLLSFEENDYVANSKANNRSWQDLCEEFIAVRKSTFLLFKSFTEEQMQSSGTANSKSITVLALGFIIIGHFFHHKNIIEERYLAVY